MQQLLRKGTQLHCWQVHYIHCCCYNHCGHQLTIVDDAVRVGLLAISTDNNWVEHNAQQHNNKFTSSPLSIYYNIIYYYYQPHETPAWETKHNHERPNTIISHCTIAISQWWLGSYVSTSSPRNTATHVKPRPGTERNNYYYYVIRSKSTGDKYGNNHTANQHLIDWGGLHLPLTALPAQMFDRVAIGMHTALLLNLLQHRTLTVQFKQ